MAPLHPQARAVLDAIAASGIDGSKSPDIAELRRLSGRGHSKGWKFNRDEIYERS